MVGECGVSDVHVMAMMYGVLMTLYGWCVQAFSYDMDEVIAVLKAAGADETIV